MCPDVSYSFPKNAGTGPLTRYIKSKHQPQQTQNNTLGYTLGPFSYNRAIGKTNLTKFLIRSEQPFSMAEDDLFTDYIRTTHNPNYEPITRNTIRSECLEYLKNKNKC